MCVGRRKTASAVDDLKAGGASGAALASSYDFAGKDCSYVQAVEWAFVKMGCAVVAKDAPSELAWKLKVVGDRSPDYLMDLFKEVVKRKCASDEGGGKAGDWDGKSDWDVLKEMQEALA